MATLSCTDSSAASSEETSDPGSPYSPSSCDDVHQRISLHNNKSTTAAAQQATNPMPVTTIAPLATTNVVNGQRASHTIQPAVTPIKPCK